MLVGGLLFVIISLFGISQIVLADNNTTSDEKRLITIFDAGNEKTILTDAKTVQDAIIEAGISLDQNDKIEPGRKTELVSSSFTINIYRARPVVVFDGERAIRIVSSSQTGRTIAYDAGVNLYPEDLAITSNGSKNILRNGGARQVVTIKRAFEINLVLYGDERRVRTQAKTVKDFLAEKELELNDNDTMNLGMGSHLRYGMTLRIWREGINTITVEEEIPYSTNIIQDADRPVGYKQIKQRGIPGKRSVTYQINMVGGVEVGQRKVIKSLTLLKPKRQVEVIGVKNSLPAGSHKDWMRAAGIRESDFGYVEYIVSRESGWGPTKSNFAGSGAYGLCQALPGSKMASAGADWATNPITQLKWCNSYAVGRYGSWAAAYKFWITHHWW